MEMVKGTEVLEPGKLNPSNYLFRKKKKLLREQRKQRERVELKMDLPGVSIADEGETGMFSLRTIRGQQVRVGWRQGSQDDQFEGLEVEGHWIKYTE